MVKDNFKMTGRQMKKSRLYTAINVLGLALGICAVLMIGVFVQNELSVSRWMADYDRIYKVEFTEKEPGHQPLLSAMTPAPLAVALKKDFPNIEQVVRLLERPVTFIKGGNRFTETVSYVDPGFFDLFTLKPRAGTLTQALKDTSSVALSQSTAQKYFGRENPIGQVIKLSNSRLMRVAAVFENVPVASHVDFQVIALLDEQALNIPMRWGSDQVHTYMKGNPHFDPATLSAGGNAFVKRNVSLGWTDLPPETLHFYQAIPVADIHLYSQMTNHEKPVSSIATVITFTIIAVFILVLAVINFTNLSIARSLRRAKEVGIRKVHGASRMALVQQFLGEAFVMVFIGFLIGAMLAEIMLPVYASYLGKTLHFDLLTNEAMLMTSVGIIFFATIGGGIYPALVLSSYRPSVILRSNQSGYQGALWFRNALVIFQFVISITLMIATALVYSQMHHIQNKDIGFEIGQKLVLPVWEKSVRPNAVALEQEIEKLPGVKSAAQATVSLPRLDGSISVFTSAATGLDKPRSIPVVHVGHDFFDFLDVKPTAGRLFGAQYKTDQYQAAGEGGQLATRSAVINDLAVKDLGFETVESAVNQTIKMPTSRGDVLVKIVGVVSGLHLDGLKQATKPMVFLTSERGLYYLFVDIKSASGDRQKTDNDTVAAISQIWDRMMPGVVMQARPVMDAYAETLEDTNRQLFMFVGFSVFSLFISCLGLFGLSAHMAEQRTREIGIRRVFGASILHIVSLISVYFSKLILIAVPIACVIAFFSVQQWLLTFADRISLLSHTPVFFAVTVGAMALVWLTTGSYAALVAKQSPLKALRYE